MSLLKKQNSFEEKLRDQIGDTEWKPSDNLWSRIEQGMDAADSFEPALRNKLDAYSLEPRKEVWEKVESELPDPPRRRGFFWFSSVAVLLLATFGAGYWFHQQTTDTRQTALSQESKQAVSAGSAISGKTANHDAAAHTDNKSANNTQPVQASAPISQEQNRVTAQKTETTQSAAAAAQAFEAAGSQQNNRTSRRVSSNTRNGAARNMQVSVSSASTIATDRGAALPPAGPVNTNNIAAGSNNPQNIAIAQSGNSGSANPATSNNSQSAPPAAGSTEETKPKVQAPLVLESLNISPQPKDSFAPDQIIRGSTYLAPDESFTRFSLSAMAGIHMSFMKLMMPQQNDYNMEQCLQLRKDLESPALDFAGGLQLNYHLGKNAYVLTGIGIVSVKQKVEFAVAPAVNSTPSRVQPVNRYVHPGDTITAGSGNSYENKYSFTEIPLYLGYRFPSERKMHFELMGGVSYARLNLVNAIMPDPSGVGMLMCDNKTDFPGFKDVFFAAVIPGATFMINSSTDLGIMLPCKMAINNMVDKDNWIGQKPATLGLSMFLRKRF